MFNKFALSVIFLLPYLIGFSQSCELSVRGWVVDTDAQTKMAYVSVYIQETGKGLITDENGYFEFTGMCAGFYHFTVSHLGCEPNRLFVSIQNETTLTIPLTHETNELEGVTITHDHSHAEENIQLISAQKIEDNTGQNLSNILAELPGVSTIKNGNNLAKPVVHGLYGNRITILNNGIAQSGQQWGNDHSPEIDPLIANKLRVVNGPNVLQYPKSNQGSVIVISPASINKDPHIHGKFTYQINTNGWGHAVNFQLQQFKNLTAWRINATLKKSGDTRTRNYFLSNTGNQEANVAFQLNHTFTDKIKAEVYLSTFNANIGVLRGSHIGNLNDLNDALNREIPFYTKSHFSYKIEAPKQSVNHHLLKLKLLQSLTANQDFEYTLATQINNRKEFDVRRSGRTDIPTLSLLQFTSYGEIKYRNKLKKGSILKTGIQSHLTANTNNPETDILPLIPDYRSFETGVYGIIQKSWEHAITELGFRYDNVVMNSATISRSIPQEIIRYNKIFHNYSASASYTQSIKEMFTIGFTAGYSTRNPGINELYSNGLHQGVSGIEEGNVDLATERLAKLTQLLKLNVNEKFAFQSLVYLQFFNNYIWLAPQDEIRQTIRGFFPVFAYQQANTQIHGLDLNAKYNWIESLQTGIAYSFIHGNNTSENLPLVNLPSNRISGHISYEFKKEISLGKLKLQNLKFKVENQYVFQQTRILPTQDFVAAPEGYNLLGIEASTNIQLKHTRLRVYTRFDNILNTSYRDYLNRLRYFADDLGFNATLGVNLSF